MSQIYVLHENPEWVTPLRQAFVKRDLPHSEWLLDQGQVPLDQEPPEGVFYNRMSASSHTRGHRFAPELTHGVLNWLEAHGRRVVNSSRALYLEVSKLAQYAALNKAQLATPRTIGAVGRDAVLKAARDLGQTSFILKPNRGGKGLGVHRFEKLDELAAYLEQAASKGETPVDGTWLVQEYIEAASPVITRVEFVGGKLLYAVQVDTSGGFELCPADVCDVDGATPQPKFRILPDFMHPIVPAYERFLKDNGIEIAGIEFIQDRAGRLFTYDINTNTNYNAQAEADAGIARTGMEAVAEFLGQELHQTTPQQLRFAVA